MATAATETKHDLGEDDRVVMPAAWGTYLRLLADRGERGRPRYLFLDGRLTALSPGVPHERLRKRLSGLLELLFECLSVEATMAGSVTLLRSRDSQEGAEPDDAYYLTNLDALEGKNRLVMGVDPPPDLVIEVVVTHSERDSLEAYRRFGVPEVWVLKESGLTFLLLRNGRYEESAFSGSLPFLAAAEMSDWALGHVGVGDTLLRRQFRAWAEQTLAPRLRPAND